VTTEDSHHIQQTAARQGGKGREERRGWDGKEVAYGDALFG